MNECLKINDTFYKYNINSEKVEIEKYENV